MNKTIPMFTALSIMLLLTVSVLVVAQESGQATGGSATTGYASTTTTTSSGNTSLIDTGVSTSPMPQFVKLGLSPNTNVAKSGEWVSYKLTIKDIHKTITPTSGCSVENGETICADSMAESMIYMPKNVYQLTAISEDGVVVELEKSEISLFNGESERIEVSVKSKKVGANSFLIQAKGIESIAKVKGTIFVKTGTADPNTPYFSGEGFAISEQTGKIVQLHLLEKNNALEGKVSISGTHYLIQGTISKNNIKFSLLNAKSNIAEGSFSGTLTKYSEFALLKGELDMQKEASYSLTAFSKRGIIVKEVYAKTTKELISTNINDIIAISSENEDEAKEVYIKPVRIRTQKLFGFIPNPWGKKVLDFEVIDGDIVTKKTIAAHETKQINGYEIQAGPLEDNDNIELSVKKN